MNEHDARRGRFAVAGAATIAALAALGRPPATVTAAQPAADARPAPAAAPPAPPAPPSVPTPAPVAEPAPAAAGSAAPDFTTVAHTGDKVALAKLRGKFVVLYFYPRDDTPGCTKEACEFRDAWARVEKAGAVVLGVSTDGNAAHKAFADKHKLPFALLPDETGDIAKKYGVAVTSGRARRVTFLIGKDGKIRRVWPAVKPAGHAAEVLAEIDAAAK